MVSFSFKTKKKTKKYLSSDEQFSRRSFLVGGIQVALGATIIGRLLYLTNFQNETYTTLSDHNRIKVRFLMPKRGIIFDRNGVVLADNRQTYRLMVVPEQTNSLQDDLHALQSYVDFRDHSLESVMTMIKAKPRFYATCIADGLSWEDVCRLEIIMRDYPGFSVEQGWLRHYPHGYSTAHVIGYVQIPSKDDQNENPVYRLADFRIGKTGLERALDKDLRGDVGYQKIEVNSRGRTVQDIAMQSSKTGEASTTTLDLRLQDFVQGQLENVESGSAVVMDVHDGSVLALVSAPSFDANVFTNGIGQKDWQDLLHSPRKCLHNKAIHGLYPPGSLFKIVVALAGFESGLIPHDYTCHCSGHMQIGTHRFHCWHKHGGHGRTDIVKALYQSCDIYFYEISQIIGHKRIEEMAQRFGLGRATGIELLTERGGLIPNEKWMKAHQNRSWMRGDTANMSIGQGALLTTPLQLAAMTASLVNPNNHLVIPSLLHKADREEFKSLDINPKSIALIQKGLAMTVNDYRGLAYRHRIGDPRLEMAGKTATCQVRRISMAERKKGVIHNDQRPWHHRDHALFCGYAPFNAPKYAAAVIIEHGGSGGSIAAPIGREILKAVQLLEPVTPQGSKGV